MITITELAMESRHELQDRIVKLEAENKKQQKDLKIVYQSLIAKDYIAAIEILSEVLKEDK